MRTVEGSVSAAEERLSPAWIVALCFYSLLPVTFAFPHLDPDWFIGLTISIAVLSAGISAVALNAHRPRNISRAERRIAMMSSASNGGVSVVMLYLGIGVTSLVEWLLQAGFDVDVTWPRMVAQYFFAAAIPIVSLGSYESDWLDQLVRRPVGVPTGFAEYDTGTTGRRFLLQTSALVIAIAAALWFATWWVSIIAVTVVLLQATAFSPQKTDDNVQSLRKTTRAALTDLGYEIVDVSDPKLVDGDASVINPIVQGVELRARRGDIDLAIAIQRGVDGVVIGWQEANRLLTAARSLSWSGASEGDEPDGYRAQVHPLLVLFDARADDSLLGFADSEGVSVVQVSPKQPPVVTAHVEGAQLEELAAALHAATNGGGNGQASA